MAIKSAPIVKPSEQGFGLDNPAVVPLDDIMKEMNYLKAEAEAGRNDAEWHARYARVLNLLGTYIKNDNKKKAAATAKKLKSQVK